MLSFVHVFLAQDDLVDLSECQLVYGPRSYIFFQQSTAWRNNAVNAAVSM